MGNAARTELLNGLCRMFLDLETMFEAIQASERSVDLQYRRGELSSFRYGLEKEDYRRQYSRLLSIIKRLRASYETVRQGT